jgi:hypothetical protein
MFKQGDKAVFAHGGDLAEVQFGPVTAVSDRDAYLVKWLSGSSENRSSVVWAVDLEPAPKFAVGQSVGMQHSNPGESFEVMAGPFWDFEKDVFWVVRNGRGVDDMAYETHMVPVVE